MKKAILISVHIGLASIPIANATTVGFGNAPSSRVVATSAGVQLSTASLVLVGNFQSEAFAFVPALSMQVNFNNISAAGNWKQYTMDTVTGTTNSGATSTYAISGTGKLFGSGADITTGLSKADYFNGKNIYVWIFDAATIAASTTMGIYKDTADTAPLTPWVFPTNGGGAPGDGGLHRDRRHASRSGTAAR